MIFITFRIFKFYNKYYLLVIRFLHKIEETDKSKWLRINIINNHNKLLFYDI